MNTYDAVEILIVEDNPTDTELTIRALKKNNLANNIFVAEDGEVALDFFFCRGKFKERNMSIPPKLVLLDLKLSKINGLEVLKIIKSDERTSFIPVVIVTSSHEEPDMREAYTLGANSYVIKPVDYEQFMYAIGTLGLFWLTINQPLR